MDLDSKHFPALKIFFDNYETVLDNVLKSKLFKCPSGLLQIWVWDRADLIARLFGSRIKFRPKNGSDFPLAGEGDSYYLRATKTIHLAARSKSEPEQLYWAFPHELAHHILENFLGITMNSKLITSFEEKCYSMWRIELLTEHLTAHLASQFFPDSPYRKSDYSNYTKTDNILNMCLLIYIEESEK